MIRPLIFNLHENTQGPPLFAQLVTQLKMYYLGLSSAGRYVCKAIKQDCKFCKFFYLLFETHKHVQCIVSDKTLAIIWAADQFNLFNHSMAVMTYYHMLRPLMHQFHWMHQTKMSFGFICSIGIVGCLRKLYAN